MSPDKISALELEAAHPEGIAARIESADLRRLLEERALLLKACELAVRDLTAPSSVLGLLSNLTVLELRAAIATVKR